MYATRGSTTKGFVALPHSLQFTCCICEAAETRPLELWRPFPSLTLFVEVDGRWCIKNNSGIPYLTDSHKKESGNQISIRDVVRSNKVCFCTARPGRCAEEDLYPRSHYFHVFVASHVIAECEKRNFFCRRTFLFYKFQTFRLTVDTSSVDNGLLQAQSPGRLEKEVREKRWRLTSYAQSAVRLFGSSRRVVVSRGRPTSHCFRRKGRLVRYFILRFSLV